MEKDEELLDHLTSLEDQTDNDVYQEWVYNTTDVSVANKYGLLYGALKMQAEAGEFANKLGKRLHDSSFDPTHPTSALDVDVFVDELGDVLWYAAYCANELGVRLDDVMAHNMDKINKRRASGVIKTG